MITRRELMIGGLAAASLSLSAFAKPSRKLKLLILGGTGYLGPHIVECATRRGHAITLFNRGKTNPQLFPKLEKLHGDRKDDLSALENRAWDAVIDTSGYFPADVARSATLLAPNISQYVFISTISVYADLSKPGMDESAPVATITDPAVEQITGETYGPLKALCEQAAEKALPGKVTNIRPGLIVGPGDPTDRFTYWPARIARGGEVLAPGSPQDPTQFIDVRDLAEFIVHCMESKTVGLFNADAPAGSLTMGQVLDASRKTVHGPNTAFTWVDAEFLKKMEVAPWSDLPIWLPATGSEAGFGQISTEKAHAAGLKTRALQHTIKDTWAWFKTLPEQRRQTLRAGLKPEKEQAALAAWHQERDAQKTPS